jgi:hypothetical protein
MTPVPGAVTVAVGPVLAHLGGLPELLEGLAPVLLFLAWRSLRGRQREGPKDRSAGRGPCAYCGAAIPQGAPRCPVCGFRTQRAEGSWARGSKALSEPGSTLGGRDG